MSRTPSVLLFKAVLLLCSTIKVGRAEEQEQEKWIYEGNVK